ncbi:MAG: HNH endonuclease [Propionibacteriaceae bacterium]|nr:HNH endonuclease [Propionibacteriaceae bacterium]
MSEVIIFNAGGQQVLGTVTVRHAAGMLYRRVALVHEPEPGMTFGPYPLPRSVVLVRWIYTAWVYETRRQPVCSRTAILRRDHYRCAYCWQTGTTMDHILPKSRGGSTSWINCVAACQECNGLKADKTPAEAGMRLDIHPQAPLASQLVPRRYR